MAIKILLCIQYIKKYMYVCVYICLNGCQQQIYREEKIKCGKYPFYLMASR